MKKCIEFNGVSKKYEVGEKAFYALDDVSFSIDQHEMVVILGPSGAGKSTLLNIMGGMDHVTDGSFYEWDLGKNKVEFYCDHILYFAGILIDDHLVIVTTDANAYVKPVHYRMPVILEKEDIDPWLKDISRTQEILSKPGIALQRKQLQEPLF